MDGRGIGWSPFWELSENRVNCHHPKQVGGDGDVKPSTGGDFCPNEACSDYGKLQVDQPKRNWSCPVLVDSSELLDWSARACARSNRIGDAYARAE